MRLQQPVRPVSLHVLAAMANWRHADAHVAHVHGNCTMIGHGADAAMTWNLDTSKYCYYNTNSPWQMLMALQRHTKLKVKDQSPVLLSFILTHPHSLIFIATSMFLISLIEFPNIGIHLRSISFMKINMYSVCVCVCVNSQMVSPL